MLHSQVRAPKPFEIICWIDHAEPVNKQVWDVPTNPDQLFPCVVFSGGFVASENDEIIELARDITEHGNTGGSVHILKRCVVYRKRVAVPRAPAKYRLK